MNTYETYNRWAEATNRKRGPRNQAAIILNPPSERVPHDATCSGCRWWSERELDGYTNRRECQRRSPAMGRPTSHASECCGDWEPKGGKTCEHNPIDALRRCIEVMEMQEKRETGEFHIPAHTMWPIWEETKEQARRALEVFGPGEIEEPPR